LRAVENIFAILPVDRESLPDRDELSDASINAQSSWLNVCGSLDNLAWLWVYEKGILTADGKPLPRTQVGLGPKCKVVRQSFSNEFQTHLAKISTWFAGIEGFRHALAHRIPFYIPPFTIDPDKSEEFQKLEVLKESAIQALNLDEHNRLNAEQQKLAKFSPIISHSFQEHSPNIFLHAQLLANFNTVHDLGRRVLVEFDR